MAHIADSIKITKQVDLGLDDILSGISELETKDLEKFMQKIGHLIARRKVAHSKGIDKAKEKLEAAKLSPRKRAAYERDTKNSHSEASWAETQLKKEQDAAKKVEDELKKEREFIEKGKIEGKIIIAKEMKTDGTSIELIMKYTGLSRNVIENL
jgi:hypothetical protein